MRKPRWQEERDDLCQWPRCNVEGGAHYTKDATKWIDREEGVWLCDAHLRTMSEELWPELEIPFKLHTEKVFIAAYEDYPREACYIHDWYKVADGIMLLVGEHELVKVEDCQEVPLYMMEGVS